MDKKRKYKEAFSDIYVSENLERKILDMTINKDKRVKKQYKLAYLILAVIMTGIISASVVYAEEIKNIINSWTSSITFEDGTTVKVSDYITFVEINEDAIKTQDYEAMVPMDYETVEQTLGVSILKSNLATSTKIGYSTGLNKDKTIGRVDLWLADMVYYDENKNISMSIAFLNKNADKEYILAFESGLDAIAGKKLEGEYHIDKLNVDAIIYSNEWSSERITAAFLHNNMIYTIIGNNISKTEMIKVLNSLK